MFTPSLLTESKTMWITLKHTGHKRMLHLLHSFFVRQFLVQTVLDVHSEIHIDFNKYIGCNKAAVGNCLL